MSDTLQRSSGYCLAVAEREFESGEEWIGYLSLFYWAETLPIYSCDDLGLCNGVSEKHDCVDCVKKRLTRYPLV